MTYLQDDPPLPPLTELFPHVNADPATFPASLDPFTVTTTGGFLPSKTPLQVLPSPFEPVHKLLEEMPIAKADGQPGLLAGFKLGPLIDAGGLPDLTNDIDKLVADDGQPDLAAITAAFRDYSFLASSYLLEPCWETWSKDNSAGYGLGRDLLPRCIAGPLLKAAEILDLPPFMSYAASYALYNYTLNDPALGPSVYSNLQLIRAFEYGLDPKSSEAGFILTHIHMVQETGPLISGAVSLLSTVESSKDTTTAISAFQTMLTAMVKIENHMEAMWSHSLPKDYNSYRTFIFGITNQSMFPNGVVYEGHNPENKPLFFRGESGANDSIIPLLDHLLEIPMPKNPLTDILKDFRSYRPKPHRQFLSYVMSKAGELGVREFCTTSSSAQNVSNDDIDTLPALYLKLVDHVRSFRWRHWLFAREYIIKRSSHPTATGGSPIVTWLPNQLMAVMDLMETVYVESGLKERVEKTNGTPQGVLKHVKEMMDNVTEQKVKLDREVKRYCEERRVD